MGVHLYFRDPETAELLHVPPHTEGGLQRMNPDTREIEPRVEAEVSITYNYSELLKLIVPDYPGMVDFFHGKSGAEMVPVLEQIVERCGTRRYRDYWAPAPGNVGAIMETILNWCRLHPKGVFEASG